MYFHQQHTLPRFYLGEEVCHTRYTPDVEVDKKDEKEATWA